MYASFNLEFSRFVGVFEIAKVKGLLELAQERTYEKSSPCFAGAINFKLYRLASGLHHKPEKGGSFTRVKTTTHC